MTLPDNTSLRRLGAFGATMLLTVTLGACQLAPPVAGSTLIDCSLAGDRITVTADSHLDPSCVYSGGFDVTTSNSTLDCQGATIRGAPSDGVGITISAPVGTDLTNVTVRNCRVEGFLNGLKITRPGFRTLPEGGEYDDNVSNIVVADSTFRDSHGVGVYVDGYVTGVTIDNDIIRNTGSSGIYLETGSRGTTVTNSIFLHNGYIENGPEGQLYRFEGADLWFWGVGREGISIDGSYDNTISDNAFMDNSNGGVLLYKNCGEYPDSPRYFPRRYPSDNNLISNNAFIDERNGVWVASRMAENTLPMDCTDPAYVDDPLKRVVRDYAKHNTVADNTFIDVTYGVRVEDDHNSVIGNHFSADSPDHHGILVGTPFRNDVLGEPVTGTIVENNTSDITGNVDPYRWIDGTTGTVDTNNTALGQPTTVCPGTEPPRSQFIFAIAIAPAGPGGTPPETTPDLTVPTLGALAPCGP